MTEALPPLRRRDEDRHPAVTQDVGHLRSFEDGVDRHEHGADHRRPEHGEDELRSLVQEQRHPLAARDSEVLQRARDTARFTPHPGVVVRGVLERQRRRVRGGARSFLEHVVDARPHAFALFPRSPGHTGHLAVQVVDG